MAELPRGTVTFLLTDVEGSTALWERDPQAMQQALARHDAITTEIIGRRGGVVVKSRGEGDSVFAAFGLAWDAVVAAADLQDSRRRKRRDLGQIRLQHDALLRIGCP